MTTFFDCLLAVVFIMLLYAFCMVIGIARFVDYGAEARKLVKKIRRAVRRKSN